MSAGPVDLRAALESLAEYEVEFVLFGSTAMHDWLVSVDAHLLLGPARRFGPRERWQMLKGGNATVSSRHGRLDIGQQIDGMPGWPELVADCEVYERDGTSVRVMNRRTLIDLKRRRASMQDLADIEAIEQLDALGD